MQIIKSNYSEETMFLLVNDIFEKTKVSDTYAQFGQKVSSYDAGDYLSIDKSFDIVINEDEKHLEAGEIISAYNDSELYNAIWNLTKGENSGYVTFEYEYCSAFTFWDGHNFKTITSAVENGDATHEICEGEGFNKMISEYETAEKIGDIPGGEVWQSENFIYHKSFWQGHFEIAEVETIEDYNSRIYY